MVGHASALVFVLGLFACGEPEKPRTNTYPQATQTGSVPTTQIGPAPTQDTAQTGLQDHEIAPGIGIGPAAIGAQYSDFVDVHGEPDALISYRRVFFATWAAHGLELVLTSSDDLAPSPDAEVIAVGTKAFDGFSGAVLPGMTRAEVETTIGISPDPVDLVHFYPLGLSVVYAGDDTVMQVTVFPAYTIRAEPPDMMAYGGTP